MIASKYGKNIIRFFMYIFILLILLFFATKIFVSKEEKNIEITKSIIRDDSEKTSIYVEYPKFNNDNIDSIIKNYIYSYIKEFKSSSETKVLDITYDIYNIDNFSNVVFNIENSLTNIKYNNIIINNDTKDIDYISSIYDIDYLKYSIEELVYHKYSIDIYNKIKNNTINNFTYVINDNKIDVYFNNIDFSNINYIPFVTIYFDENVSYFDEEYTSGKKYIAFTFDDGPSKYTSDLLKTLELNNSSATFFMIGNRMNEYKNVVLDVYNSNSEVGNHTYSHKNLTQINYDELNEELSKTEDIFYNITGSYLKYLRPPYDYYNEEVLNSEYSIVTWNIDPKDWLNKDSKKIYNNIIKYSCDGCIVIMHDIYSETLEATKMLLPTLNEMGYEVVSISKLIEIKGYDISNQEIISSIK